MNEAYSKETAAELFELRVRGLLALAFSRRGVEPNGDQWDMLRDEKEITLRDVGEITYLLDFDIEMLSTIHIREPEQTDE